MINIIVALPCEARPLINALHLQKRVDINAFSLFCNKKQHDSGKESGEEALNLMVSGPGKLAAATATAYLQGLQHNQPVAAWLNVGIAGSSAFNVGDMALAHRVIDSVTHKHFYPGLCFELPCVTADVVSVETPEIQYQEPAVFEMEAAGFYSAAMRFAPSEVIHCMKVISDNHEQSIEKINEKVVVELITQHLPEIQQVIASLNTLADELSAINTSPSPYESIIARWHFTVSQQQQLKNLLWRWKALSTQSITDSVDFTQCKHGKDILHSIEAHLVSFPVHFHRNEKTKSTLA